MAIKPIALSQWHGYRAKSTSLLVLRRSVKTWFCYQQMQELLGKGLEKERLLYLNFEDERLDIVPA